MIYKCYKCGKLSNLDKDISISKIDAVGFVILLALIAIPVWFFSSLVASSLFYEETASEDPMRITVVSTMTFIQTAIFFSLAGSKIAKFLSFFVNYKAYLKFYCKKCGIVFKEITIPEIENNQK